MNDIFDSHAHYDDAAFQGDQAAVIEHILAHGVTGVVNVGCDAETSQKSIALAKKYSFFHAAVGVHPQAADEVGGDWLEMIEQLSYDASVVAIGEIGLDYHYDDPSREKQAEIFEAQLDLARRRNLPVIIHSRDATEDTLRLLQKYRLPGVVHCYTGSPEIAREILSLGMYLGFTGVVTFKNARRVKESAALCPLDRLLLETDCPYMAPEPFRGKRCTSDMIERTAAAIAEIKGTSPQEVVDAARENTRIVFRLS